MALSDEQAKTAISEHRQASMGLALSLASAVAASGRRGETDTVMADAINAAGEAMTRSERVLMELVATASTQSQRDLIERMIADIEMGGVMVMIPMIASRRMGVVDTRDWIRSFLSTGDK